MSAKKVVAGEARALLIAFELGHVDAVGGEPAKRLVERRGHVLHLEHERRHRDITDQRLRIETQLREHHEPRGVVGGILDVGRDNIEPVEFGGERGRDRAGLAIALLPDERRGARGVGVAHRDDAVLAQIATRLAERLRGGCRRP